MRQKARRLALADATNRRSARLLPFSFCWMLVCKETGGCNGTCCAAGSHALTHQIAPVNTP